MTKDFYERFKLPIGLDEARLRFVNRAQNLIFNGLLYRCRPHEDVSREIATTLGVRYQYQMNPSEYIQGDFTNTLRAIEGFYRANTGLNSQLDSHVKRLIEESEVSLSIRWQGGRFFPEGAPILDQRLVNDLLGWLDAPELRTVLDPFQKGLRHLLDSAQRAELRADVVTDMYEALEALAKFVTGRAEKDLSANRELFIRKVRASEPYKRLLKEYIDYANDFRHAATSDSPRPAIDAREAESFVYLTGLFLRLAMPRADA